MSKALRVYRLGFIAVLTMLSFACNPEAPWTTKKVEISMSVENVSAGFIECSFSTTKEAYYLIACQPAIPGVNPMNYQKQFMTLALDSANSEYIQWRNGLLKAGEFNIAPFSSHALQYGSVHHFFTGLIFDQEYWVYAFIVDPVSMKPAGKLYLQTIKTKYESEWPIRFEYRVKGNWDYVYPVDSTTNTISTRFPYVSTTRDSVEIAEILEWAKTDTTSIYQYADTPQEYFYLWMLEQFAYPQLARVLYGVLAIENDGIGTHLFFQEGHTYYTFIGGFDWSNKQLTLYKFHWTGEDYEAYFTEKDNIAFEGYEDFDNPE